MTRQISSARALWLIGRLAFRRQINVWQSLRLNRKKKQKATSSPSDASATRTATPSKFRGRSVFAIFLFAVMGINGFNIASTEMRAISAGVLNLADADRIQVSPSTFKEIRQAADALRNLNQLPNAENKKYQAEWNDYLDQIFRIEIGRKALSDEDASAQLKQMQEAFAHRGVDGFEVRRLHWAIAGTWPSDAAGGMVFLRTVGWMTLLWVVAILFTSLGTNNKDLGQVEWSFQWLYTFPVPARTLFVSNLFGYSFFNPAAWFFFLPFVIAFFMAGGHGWMSLPLGLVAFIWLLLLTGAVAVLGEVAMRKYLGLGKIKNLQALSTLIGMAGLLLAFASGLSKPVDDLFVRHSTAATFNWNPFSLPLYFALPAATLHDKLISVGAMMIVLIAAVSIALFGSEALTRDGLVREGGPYQARRQASPRGFRGGWLGGIPSQELLLLARDRNLMVQVLIVPLLLPGYYLLTNSRMASAVGTSLRHAAMMAFAVGAYSYLNSAMPVLNREDKTLWHLLSFPQSLASILLKKVMVWAGVGVLYGALALGLLMHFRHMSGNDWGSVVLALYGIALYAFIASGIGILATNVLETSRRARFRTDMVYLYTILGVMWASTIYLPSWWTRLAQVVLSTLLAFALWQKVRDVAPYLLDPTQLPPRSIGLADGMIAILAFFVLQGLIFILLQSTLTLALGTQITISYAAAGGLVASLTLFILGRQQVPDLWEKIGFKRGPNPQLSIPRSLLLGAASGATAAAGAWVYTRVLMMFPQSHAWRHSAERLSMLQHGSPVWIYILGVAAAPLCEEFLFRGLVFQGLLRGMRPALAVVSSAALFALVHPPIAAIPVFGLGVAAAISFRRSGFLGAAIAAHAVYNGIVIFFR